MYFLFHQMRFLFLPAAVEGDTFARVGATCTARINGDVC